MKTVSLSVLLSLLLAAPLAAEQHTADATADGSDTITFEPADAPQAEGGDDVTLETCDAGAYAEHLGKTAAEIEAMKFDVPVRVIPENGIVTMDFLPDRVNFELDADGTVSEISCG